jgi:hypothetical protein
VFGLEFDYGTLTLGLRLGVPNPRNDDISVNMNQIKKMTLFIFQVVYFVLDESSFGLKLSLNTQFYLPMCPGTLKVVVGVRWMVLKPNLVLCFGTNHGLGPSRTILRLQTQIRKVTKAMLNKGMGGFLARSNFKGKILLSN